MTHFYNSNWNIIDDKGEIENINERSKSENILILKHSIICPLSDIAYQKVNLELEHLSQKFVCFLVIVQEEREISFAIAEKWGIQHESPQVMIIKDQNCIYHESHLHINPVTIFNQLYK